MTSLTRADVVLGAGAKLRVIGRGRKERCTPLARSTRVMVKTWLREPQGRTGNVLFPSAKGTRLTVRGVQYLLNKHRLTASKVPVIEAQAPDRSPIETRHGHGLLQAGVDRSVIVDPGCERAVKASRSLSHRSSSPGLTATSRKVSTATLL
jgi:site-specific recombinase XerC